MVLALKFMSLIHFQLTFIYDVRKRYNFSLLHVDIQFSQYHLLKRWFFPCWILLTPLLKMCGFLSGPFILFFFFFSRTLNSIWLVYMSIHMLGPHCFDDCSFVVSFEIRKCGSSNFVFFFFFQEKRGGLCTPQDQWFYWEYSCHPVKSFELQCNNSLWFIPDKEHPFSAWKPLMMRNLPPRKEKSSRLGCELERFQVIIWLYLKIQSYSSSLPKTEPAQTILNERLIRKLLSL